MFLSHPNTPAITYFLLFHTANLCKLAGAPGGFAPRPLLQICPNLQGPIWTSTNLQQICPVKQVCQLFHATLIFQALCHSRKIPAVLWQLTAVPGCYAAAFQALSAVRSHPLMRSHHFWNCVPIWELVFVTFSVIAEGPPSVSNSST